MSTLDTLETAVRYTLGEASPSFWTSPEIQTTLIYSIRALLTDVTPDAFHNLVWSQSANVSLGDSGLRDVIATTYWAKILSLVTEESDGEYGYPWKEVSLDTFEEIRRGENITDATADQTETRIFTVYAVGGIPTYKATHIRLYPAVTASHRAYKMTGIYILSESGTLMLPLFTEELVVNRTISIAASKKSRDLDMADRFAARYERGVAAANARYTGRHGLQAATVSRIRVA